MEKAQEQKERGGSGHSQVRGANGIGGEGNLGQRKSQAPTIQHKQSLGMATPVWVSVNGFVCLLLAHI